MDLDTIFRLLGSIAAMIGVAWTYYRFSTSQKSNLRDAYLFARDFLKDVEDGKLHPFAEELGYQAVAGNSGMTMHEVKYILSLAEPAQRLRDYMFSRTLFIPFEKDNPSLVLRRLYRHAYARALLSILGFLLYMASAFVLFSPLLFPSFFSGSQSVNWQIFMIFVPIFSPIAYLGMKYCVKVKIASNLLMKQRSHLFNFMISV